MDTYGQRGGGEVSSSRFRDARIVKSVFEGETGKDLLWCGQ